MLTGKGKKERQHGVVCKKKETQTSAMSQTTKKLIFWVKHPFRSRKKKRCEQYEQHKVPAVRLRQRRGGAKTKQSNKARGICSQDPLEHGAIDTRSNNCGAVSNEDRLPVSRGVASPREPAFSSSFLLSWNTPIMSG